MLGVNNYSKLRRQNKLDQSYLYISNSMMDILKDREIKVIGLTSSFTDKKSKDIICENICKHICNRGSKVCLITAYVDINNKNYTFHEAVDNNLKIIRTQNISESKLEELIDKEKDHSAVIINISPINIFAQALGYAKICKNVLLLEKYCHSRYDEFENTLDILKQNNINALGIITHV